MSDKHPPRTAKGIPEGARRLADVADAARALLPHLPTENDVLNDATVNEGRASPFGVATIHLRHALHDLDRCPGRVPVAELDRHAQLLEHDGRWTVTENDERWGWPESSFATREEAVAFAEASNGEFLYVGRVEVATPERVVARCDLEGMLERLDEDAFERWGHDDGDFLPWKDEDLAAMRRALAAVFTRRALVPAWFVVHDVERVGDAS